MRLTQPVLRLTLGRRFADHCTTLKQVLRGHRANDVIARAFAVIRTGAESSQDVPMATS